MPAALERPTRNVLRGTRHTQFHDSEYGQRLLLGYRRTGEGAARERLVELYLPLVRALARRYVGLGERFDDLVQVGAIGLLEAIERFDPKRGHDFVAFAVPTITGEMKNHLRDRTTVVHVPRRLQELAARLRAARARLAVDVRGPANLAELAREAGMRVEDVEKAVESEHARAPLSLWSEAEERELEASAAGNDAFTSSEHRLLLASALRTLAARERRIVHLRFFVGLTQNEIAAELGLSQIQVSRLIRSSLERMSLALADHSRNVQ